MSRCHSTLAVLALVAAGSFSVLSAPVSDAPGGGHLFTITETPELQKHLDRYGLTAGKYIQPRAMAASAAEDRLRYERVKGKPFPAELRYLLFAPDSNVMREVPLVVYFPGSGETGFDLTRQFRQRSIFGLVTSAQFQNTHPCYFMAISLPDGTRTMYDGLPGHPSAIQDLVMGAIRAVAASSKRPKIDTSRLYAIGFSFGGECVYGIALAYPGSFAGAIPVASFPPPPGFVSKEHPGAWWHIYNDGDYTAHGVTGAMLKPFVDRVVSAGGEFRTGTYPRDGHNAWSAAWQETAAWEWLFSKSTSGRKVKDIPLRQDIVPYNKDPSLREQPSATQPPKAQPIAEGTRKIGKSDAERHQEQVAKDISDSKCSASVPGKGRDGQPCLAVDGLDGTAYTSASPMKKGDWFMVELATPSVGSFCIKTGHVNAKDSLQDGSVETSADGCKWKRRGKFAGKSGECDFRTRDEIVKFIRILPNPRTSQPLVVREITITP